MKTLSQSWLIIQFMALLTATSIVAGGGQFPGNAAHMIVYIKFILFLLPVSGLTFKLLHEERFTLRDSVCPLIQKNRLLILFLIALLISIPLSSYPSFSLQRCLYTYLGFGSLFCLVAQYHALKNDHTVFNQAILIISSFLLIILACSSLLPFPSLRMNIQSIGLIHPNMLSSLLAQLLLVVMIVPVDAKLRPVSYIIILCFIVAIFALQSRGVIIGLIVALIAYLSANSLLYKSRLFLILLLALMALACTGLIIVLFVPSLLQDVLPFVSRGQSIEDLMSFSNRLYLWDNLLSSITFKQLWVGHGYALMSPDIAVDFGNGILYGAHNAYLALFLGTGFIPLTLFLSYWLAIICTIIRHRFRADKPLVMLVISSMALFFTHAMVGEEFGLHLTPTCMLLVFHTQRLLKQQAIS